MEHKAGAMVSFAWREAVALYGVAQCFTLLYMARLYDQNFCIFQVKGICIITLFVYKHKLKSHMVYKNAMPSLAPSLIQECQTTS